MRRRAKLIVACVLMVTFSGPVFASDWDVAGKVLTGIEGLRILSGGRIDPVGSLFGLNGREKDRRYEVHHYYVEEEPKEYCKKVWVPTYKWKKKWVPGHYVYDKRLGRRIYVEGRYVRYKVKKGGYWRYECYDACDYSYSRH